MTIHALPRPDGQLMAGTPEPTRPPRIGLVLTGGGARAAYQVGALRGLAKVLGEPSAPFQIVTGVSAGAINGCALAARANTFSDAVRDLCELWSSLEPDSIYRTDLRGVGPVGASWIRDILTGGHVGETRINYLLDTTPLRQLLEKRLALEQVVERFRDGSLHGCAVTATNYATGTALTFFDGAAEIVPWQRSTRLGIREPLTIEHVLASAAIPIFFPPIALRGSYYGDGCIRMNAPLSPAIHLGADRIVAIGIRYFRTTEQTLVLNQPLDGTKPSIADIAGLLLNAVFLDSIEGDLERLERINRTLALLPSGTTQPLRHVPVLALRPSEDIGRMAAQQYTQLPATLRYLLSGIGATADRGWDLVSYLAFEPIYIRRLVELGYQDTLARHREIEQFFAAPSQASART